jgi:hypothetical protein
MVSEIPKPALWHCAESVNLQNFHMMSKATSIGNTPGLCRFQNGQETNTPSVCYVYEHRDNIAKLNDSIEGQKNCWKT